MPLPAGKRMYFTLKEGICMLKTNRFKYSLYLYVMIALIYKKVQWLIALYTLKWGSSESP